ncbi:MAG: shikimate dehydrogenase [Leptospiraceae bacterium]|nr:shikimate dehydrogenase [Leptospiraceae bacterium]MDW7975912.1 shikimate dehydrogenase [Leptospiraceae bacterium]
MNIDGETKVYGIIGNPLSHSLSPIIHNHIFSHYKMNAVYIPFAAELNKNEKKYIQTLLKNFHVQGLSVTIPYKSFAYEIAHLHDEISKFTHASNTLMFKDQKIMAYNTDGIGALRALQKVSSLHDKSILILGYGGSSSAITGALIHYEKPKRIVITGRDPKKGKNFLKKFKGHPVEFIENEKLEDNYEIIINTTPIGMKNFPEKKLFIDEGLINKDQVVMDIVYNPIETPLLKLAKKKKATVIEGYWMFLYQAIYQSELFIEKKIEEPLIQKIKQLILKNLK